MTSSINILHGFHRALRIILASPVILNMPIWPGKTFDRFGRNHRLPDGKVSLVIIVMRRLKGSRIVSFFHLGRVVNSYALTVAEAVDTIMHRRIRFSLG